MNKLITTFVLTIFWTSSYSQFGLNWSRDFEAGLVNTFSEGPEIHTDDELLKVTGIKNTPGGQRLETVVYNLQGEMITSTSYGKDLSNNTIVDYKLGTDHQVYLLVQQMLEFYKSKIVLQKYSADGTLLWSDQIQDSSPISYRPHSIGLTIDNGIFITGYKETNYPDSPTDSYEIISVPCLYLYSENGNFIWAREFSNDESAGFAYKIIIHDENAFLFSYNARFLKVDPNNNLTIYLTTGLHNGISDVQLSADNNFIVTAFTKYKVSKVNLDGLSIWNNEYGTFLPANYFGDQLNAIVQDEDGNIYVTGKHYGHNLGTPAYTNADILTLKYSSTGTLLWENRYQYGVNNADIGSFISIKNGFVYVGGHSQRLGMASDYDYLALKINSATGETTYAYRYNGISNGDDLVSSICILENGNIALTGYSYMNPLYDWTTQFLADSNLSAHNTYDIDQVEIAPNPVSTGSQLTISGQVQKYKIISLFGQVVQAGNLENQGMQTIIIDKLVVGLYILELEGSGKKIIRKLLVK